MGTCTYLRSLEVRPIQTSLEFSPKAWAIVKRWLWAWRIPVGFSAWGQPVWGWHPKNHLCQSNRKIIWTNQPFNDFWVPALYNSGVYKFLIPWVVSRKTHGENHDVWLRLSSAWLEDLCCVAYFLWEIRSFSGFCSTGIHPIQTSCLFLADFSRSGWWVLGHSRELGVLTCWRLKQRGFVVRNSISVTAPSSIADIFSPENGMLGILVSFLQDGPFLQVRTLS